MSNMGASLAQPAGYSLKHLSHSRFPVQHASGFFVWGYEVLYLLLHVIVDPLELNNLEQHIVYLRAQQFMLGIVLGIVVFECILLKNSIVQFILDSPQGIFSLFYFFGLFFVFGNKLVQLVRGIFQLLFFSGAIFLNFINLVLESFNLFVELVQFFVGATHHIVPTFHLVHQLHLISLTSEWSFSATMSILASLLLEDYKNLASFSNFFSWLMVSSNCSWSFSFYPSILFLSSFVVFIFLIIDVPFRRQLCFLRMFASFLLLVLGWLT